MEDINRAMKVAVLIDAENISYKYAQLILEEAGRFGNVVCRRIYGDWSATDMKSWRQPIMDYSIHAIQQFKNTSGKNASDSALIIDAMDIVHEHKYQCICIVSSDSDFTRLASRLREAEVYVVGMGEQKTPSSFKSACDKYLYLDVLLNEEIQNDNKEGVSEHDKKQEDVKESKEMLTEDGLNIDSIKSTIDDILETNSDEEGWVHLGALGDMINRKITDFDVRNFGYKKLSSFITSLGCYEIKSVVNDEKQNIKVVYARKTQEDKLNEH